MEKATRGRDPLPSVLESLPGNQPYGRASSNSVNTQMSRDTEIMEAFNPQSQISTATTREEALDAYNSTTAGQQLQEIGISSPGFPVKKKAPTFFDRMKETFTTVKGDVDEQDPDAEYEITVKQEVIFCLLGLALVIIVIVVSLSLE